MGTVLKILGVVFLVIVLVGAGVVGAIYFLGTKDSKNNSSQAQIIISQITDKVSPTTNQSLFSGSVKLLSQDLGLVPITTDEKLNKYTVKTLYYEAGKFESGDLVGYTRIILVREATSPAGPTRLIFVTKDFNTYMIDSKMDFKDDDFLSLDRTKVTSSVNIPSEHLEYLKLDDTFYLNKNNLLTFSSTAGGETLQIDFSTYTSLKSPNGFKFFSIPRNQPNEDVLKQKYFTSDTSVIVVDSTGLAYRYDLTNNVGIVDYPSAFEKYLQGIKAYEAKKIKDYPPYPTKPGLRFDMGNLFYQKYDVAVPSACAMDVNTWVLKNVTDADFVKVGTSPDGDVFRLVNSNHDLYKLEYKSKVQDTPDDIWKDLQKVSKPSFTDYVSKNPLLFFKDFWGRWVVLGEYDYKLMGGCGKPVIYLYPQKDTQVSINFTSPMQLDVAIPAYQNGWNVMARTDGTISELGTKTDCSTLNTARFGSEYADSACVKNIYPYIYWAGQSLEKRYPQINAGWIVVKNDLGIFLNEKLDLLGLNTKEKTDMLNYWLPKIEHLNAPFYRISFLQTNEMNEIAPMLILPTPNSLFRIFLDVTPLSEKPLLVLKPQVLNQIHRHGFTVVEWGGKLY